MGKEKILFRASAAGNLMVGGNQITEKQLSRLKYLKDRHSEYVSYKRKVDAGAGQDIPKVRPLTEKMKKEMSDLQIAKDAPFELGETAKTYVESVWLRKEYGYEEPVVTPQMLKGHLVEQDAIGLVSKVWKMQEFRTKNRKRFTNDYFSGCPDVVTKSANVVEDVKSCWTLRTYFEIRKVNPLYYGQGQVYMDLTGKRKFRLHYCLVETPEELIKDQELKYFYKYGADPENPHYQEVCEMLRKNNDFKGIPVQDRVKTFEFDYDEAYIKELKSRVEVARNYYSTLTLKPKKSTFASS